MISGEAKKLCGKLAVISGAGGRGIAKAIALVYQEEIKETVKEIEGEEGGLCPK